MMISGSIALCVIALMAGVIIGSKVADHNWRENSKYPMRKMSNGIFYKVVRVDDEKSWEHMDIQRDY